LSQSQTLEPQQPPVLEDFYYKVVPNQPCTDAEAASPNPACLKTTAQLNADIADYQESGACW